MTDTRELAVSISLYVFFNLTNIFNVFYYSTSAVVRTSGRGSYFGWRDSIGLRV